MRFDIADTGISEDRARVVFKSRKTFSKIANLSDRKFRRGNTELSFAIPYFINQSSLVYLTLCYLPPTHPSPLL